MKREEVAYVFIFSLFKKVLKNKMKQKCKVKDSRKYIKYRQSTFKFLFLNLPPHKNNTHAELVLILLSFFQEYLLVICHLHLRNKQSNSKICQISFRNPESLSSICVKKSIDGFFLHKYPFDRYYLRVCSILFAVEIIYQLGKPTKPTALCLMSKKLSTRGDKWFP